MHVSPELGSNELGSLMTSVWIFLSKTKELILVGNALLGIPSFVGVSD